jgi:hypothetical protein
MAVLREVLTIFGMSGGAILSNVVLGWCAGVVV